MTKTYLIENLDCANCAAKVERKIREIPGVEDAVLTFTTRQLRVTAEDPDGLLPRILEEAQKVEAQVEITSKDTAVHQHHEHCGCGHDHDHHEHCCCGHDHDHHEHCSCGHDHDHHEHCSCGHDHDHGVAGESVAPILVGAGLFAGGLLLQWLLPDIPLGAAFFVAAYLALGLPVLKTAVKNLIRGQVFDENFLMSIATLGAFAIGEFPEAVGIMLFYRVGEYFEHKAVERSRRQIMEAVDLRPEQVNLLRGEQVHTVSPEEIAVGDLLLIRPGDRIGLDAVVVSGESRIDTSPITGEPVPVCVKTGDEVTSGCVNISGALTVSVLRPLGESMVTRILNSVENAAASKPKAERFITRFSRIYTPTVVVSALLTAVLPPLIFKGDWGYWSYTALSFLVMSCPCALVLSVPLAFFSGIGVGSRQGILFKGGMSIEALADVKAVVMDKTGTLTKGDFSLQRIFGDEEVLRLCAGCEQRSTHPVAQSIVRAALERGMTLDTPQELEEIPGHGIRAVMNGKTILCGNEKLMEKFAVSGGVLPTASYGTVVFVAVDGIVIGSLLISDTVKEDATEGIAALKRMDLHTAMLTGDDRQAAQAVAKQLRIDETAAKLLPDEKLEVLRGIRQEKGKVMFVGDGINDAPVLSGADVGAAMGSGADAAIEAADVVFMTGQVTAIAEAIRIAQRTRKIAWQNVIFALGIKLAVMALGLLGHASMWLAVFADSGVAMLCVLNAIRMLYRKK